MQAASFPWEQLPHHREVQGGGTQSALFAQQVTVQGNATGELCVAKYLELQGNSKCQTAVVF
eukprot:SAG11_NODE_2010_length_3926_cov_2.164359_1_plen_61_part_10